MDSEHYKYVAYKLVKLILLSSLIITFMSFWETQFNKKYIYDLWYVSSVSHNDFFFFQKCFMSKKNYILLALVKKKFKNLKHFQKIIQTLKNSFWALKESPSKLWQFRRYIVCVKSLFYMTRPRVLDFCLITWRNVLGIINILSVYLSSCCVCLYHVQTVI